MLTGPVLVELIDGRMVSRCAEEWRAECLARHVVQLPSLAARREWLADFEKKNGAAQTEALKKTMQTLHNSRGRTMLKNRDV